MINLSFCPLHCNMSHTAAPVIYVPSIYTLQSSSAVALPKEAFVVIFEAAIKRFEPISETEPGRVLLRL